ncbi:MAG: hypothetical protein GC189_00395 [Alphaproteobacteria bacterium]|nr:hypothetical protein [Alphaproteobacteria bacterium]
MKTFVAALVALAAFAAPAAALSPGRVAFDVTRNGQPFGRHEVVVTQAGPATEVRSTVRLSVRAGPLTVFRYEHDCVETWSQDALQALACSTLKDGRRTRVEAARQGAALRVTGAQGAATVSGALPPTSWPTTARLEGGSYIDTETGATRDIRISRIGREVVQVAGRPVTADRYRIASSLVMDAWYDAQGRWVKAAFTARGQRIEYTLATPLSAAPTPS